jgi:hypothetical protein
MPREGISNNEKAIIRPSGSQQLRPLPRRQRSLLESDASVAPDDGRQRKFKSSPNTMSTKAMTEKQRQQFNRMRHTLKKIYKYYQTPDQLRRNSEKDYGLGFQESLEMAYENLQSEAQYAVKGIKELKAPKPNGPGKTVDSPVALVIALLISVMMACRPAAKMPINLRNTDSAAYFNQCRDSMIHGYCLIHCFNAGNEEADFEAFHTWLDLYGFYRHECLRMLPEKRHEAFLRFIVQSLDSCKCK